MGQIHNGMDLVLQQGGQADGMQIEFDSNSLNMENVSHLTGLVKQGWRICWIDQ